jgi:hypothetical protein
MSRMVSSTDRPTGRSLMVIWRTVPAVVCKRDVRNRTSEERKKGRDEGREEGQQGRSLGGLEKKRETAGATKERTKWRTH